MRQSKERKYDNSIKNRKQEVNAMLHNTVDTIMQENIDRNISTKVDSNNYCEGKKLEEVEYYPDL